MSLGLHGDAQAVLAGITYDFSNLVCVARPCHHRRLLVEGQVERRARGIPLLVAAFDELCSIQHSTPSVRRSCRPFNTWPCSAAHSNEISSDRESRQTRWSRGGARFAAAPPRSP